MADNGCSVNYTHLHHQTIPLPKGPEEQSEFQRLRDEHAKLTSRILGVSGEQTPVAAQDEGGQPRQVSDQAPPPLTGQQISSPSPGNSLSKKGTSKTVIFAVGLLALFLLARAIGAIGKPNDSSPPAASEEATVAPTPVPRVVQPIQIVPPAPIAPIQITAVQLHQEYDDNEVAADAKYKGRVSVPKSAVARKAESVARTAHASVALRRLDAEAQIACGRCQEPS